MGIFGPLVPLLVRIDLGMPQPSPAAGSDAGCSLLAETVSANVFLLCGQFLYCGVLLLPLAFLLPIHSTSGSVLFLVAGQPSAHSKKGVRARR